MGNQPLKILPSFCLYGFSRTFDKNSRDIFSSNQAYHQIGNIIKYNIVKLQVSTPSCFKVIRNLIKKKDNIFIHGKFQKVTFFLNSQNLGQEIIIISQEFYFYTCVQNLKAICSLFLEKKEFEEKKRTKNKQKTHINVFSEKYTKHNYTNVHKTYFYDIHRMCRRKVWTKLYQRLPL